MGWIVPGIERTPEKRAADLKEMARLRLFGHSQTEIAERLGIGQATVSRDLAEIVKGWKAEAVSDMDEIKAKELAKLDALEVEAYGAWVGSKKESQKTVVEERPGKGTKDDKPDRGGNLGKFIKIEKQTSDGDPRFLQALLAIQDRRAKILGFDVPVKFDGTVTNKATIDASALSDAALEEILAARDAMAAAEKLAAEKADKPESKPDDSGPEN
jgi:hypothetical protein